jgi:hypothetical protein
MMKLVEEVSGTGDLMLNGDVLRTVRYRIRRYQGVIEQSGLPIPGLHRLEGAIDFDPGKDPLDWIGAGLNLRLDDGRVLGITIADPSGRVLNEGHGPSKCQCC